MDGFNEVLQGTNFSGLDWAIVAVYLLVAVAAGLIANRYVSDMTDYVVAGRGVRTALGIATLTGGELGLVTVMYNAEKGFTGGFAAFHIGVVGGVVTLAVGLTGFIVAALRRHEVLTIPEFYGKRFGPRTRILGGIVLAVAGILNMGMFLKAGSIFVVGVTGLPADSAALVAVMLVLLALVLFYTMLGGMVSVVLTDYVQFVVLSFGLLLGTGIVLARFGWEPLVEQVWSARGEGGFNPVAAESAFGLDYIVFMLFGGLVSCAIWPTSLMRALSCESERVVRRQYTWASLSFALRVIIPCFWGVAAYVLVQNTPELRAFFLPDEGASQDAVSSLYAMPMLLGRLLPVGVLGLVAAAMLAAFMSTHDTYFLTWSSTLTNDVIGPLWRRPLSQRAQVMTARGLILLIGVVLFLISYAFPLGEDLWDYLLVSGAIYTSSAFPVLTAGLYWKRASSTGAVLAMLAGCFAVLGIEAVRLAVFGGLLGLPGPALAALTGTRIGLGVVALAWVLMVAGSLLFPDRPKEAAA